MFRVLLRIIAQLAVVALLAVAALVKADGVSDLRQSLAQLQSKAPIVVDAQFTLFGRSGDHEQLIDREGLINLRFEDDESGLRVIHSPELIELLH